ncbi:GGDEF domain-containing phosphodiesterase [Fusibacter sp. 3D3]|uniref:bifunctional diguanylate cyclase/phosphodiesterase n=1 Tax=Fusibacter sp. 3D3 TaxID=1048380 RepID=UPI000852A7F7|nr:GGDEF domain-containing phosphodiesterase [Fusibacter sp. 3D3]GAU77220.1 diguanylate cyclase/phosphodiesterase [Fusibacter sp. 3D3]
MKSILFKMVVLLLLVSILGAALNMRGQTLFVSAIEEALFERDMAYIDHTFDRLNIILTLASGEIQKWNTIEENMDIDLTKYRLGVLKETLSAEQLYLFDKELELIESTGTLKEAKSIVMLLEQNLDHLSMETISNTFGYYVNPVDHKIKIVSQQYFEKTEIHIIQVHDLIQVMLRHYPVAVYESLYPYLLNDSSEYIDIDTQFKVTFLSPDELEQVKEQSGISALEVGNRIVIKRADAMDVFELATLDQKMWLEHPLLLRTITYENFKLSKMRDKMLLYIVLIIGLLILLTFLIYYKLIYKGLIHKITVLNNQIIENKSDHNHFNIEETGISEIDTIMNAYKSLKLLLNERENFIAEMGYFDTITGVGNIYLLEKDLNTLLSTADESDHISLVSIHLKNDREIVEQLSNENIQMFLSTFMTQIKTAFGFEAVYRTADYTFAALSSLNDEYGVIKQIQKLQDSMKKLLPNNEIELKIVAARYPEHGRSGDELINNIEIASQSQSNQTVIFYSQRLKDVYQKQLQLESDLKMALKNNEIFVVYQPVVDPYTFKIKGVEALVRWKRKNEHHVSPEIFIAIAEKLGIVEEIDKWVFEKSCRMLMLWEEIFEEDFFVSINTSPIWFTSPDFIKYIHDTMITLNVNPSKICLEITETCLIEDINLANGIILEAKALGVKIALDDFGKGYSSLNYLRRLEIDKLKIDKDFLLEMDFESQEYNLIDSIVDMAHHMNFEIVVEGVEEMPQLDYLKTLNVEMIQGYLFSQPLDKKEISQLLLEGGFINPKHK